MTPPLAEAFNSLFKVELVRTKVLWKNPDDRELAIAEYVDWFNHHRLRGEIGLVPPAEFEEGLLPSQPRADYRRRVRSEPRLNPG